MAEEDAKAAAMSAKQQQQQQANYTQKIVDAWRRRFPNLDVSLESMMPRLSDVVEKRNNAASAVKKSAQSKSTDPQSRSQSRANSLEMAEDAYRRGPTTRGQMNWNQITVSDLLNVYDSARGQPGDLREALHKGFTKFNPHCRLSSAVLLAKVYEWREKENSGEFTRTPPTITALKVEHDVKSEAAAKTDNDETEVGGGGNGNAGSIVYRTWSKEMIDNMVKTRRIAIEKKKRMGIASRKSFQLVDLWHTEFTAMHPDFKCTKRNLLRKYNWYRNRNKFPDAPDGSGGVDDNGDRSAAPSAADVKMEEEAKKAVQVGNIIRIKAIRKDVFLHVKSLMEESRIFLPLKLPVEAELKPEFVTAPLTLPVTAPSQQYQRLQQPPPFFPQQQVLQQQQPPPPQMQLNLDRASASQALVQLHQQAMQENLRGLSQPPQPPMMTAPMPPLPPNVSLPTHITVTPQPQEDEERDKKEAIKLPGGATLVAVTERNSVGLLKPKPMEKPHVTITIGNKNKDSPVEDTLGNGGDLSPIDMTKTANLEPPPQPIILPINVPRFPLPNQPLPPLPPPPAHQQPQHQQPMPQLTYVRLSAHVTPKAIFIPSRVKAKIDEVGLNDRDFIQLLEVYEKARNEYIDTLKRGYLAFFPYVLGGIWRREATEGGVNGAVNGRKLQVEYKAVAIMLNEI